MNTLNKVELQNILKKLEVDNDKIIVLVDTTSNKSLQSQIGMKNIYCIDADNNILWQIFLTNGSEKSLNDTFMYVNLDKEGQLNAKTFFGMEYLVNINTGAAEQTGWKK